MLEEITRSRRAVLPLTVGAGPAGSGVRFRLRHPRHPLPRRPAGQPGPGTAVDWLTFTAFSVGLAGVALTGWEAAIGRGWQSAVGLLSAAGASLLMTIGQLVVAANSPTVPTPARW